MYFTATQPLVNLERVKQENTLSAVRRPNSWYMRFGNFRLNELKKEFIKNAFGDYRRQFPIIKLFQKENFCLTK